MALSDLFSSRSWMMIHIEKLNIPSLEKDVKRRSMPKFVTPFVLCLTMALTSCAGRIHHIDVGAVPDDYRTRHPIVISEQDKTLDLPVSQYSLRLTPAVGDTIHGFAQGYLASNAEHMTIMRPAGSGNAHAAKTYAQKVLKKLAQYGVSTKQVTIVPYEAHAHGDQAPIRLVYSAISASTEACGKWEEDMLANNWDNKQYANFGCATQSNLANQIANPLDLVRPRGETPVDAARRATAIGNYQTNGANL